jgi:multiple sugar transport system ATP-binding protein
VAGFIGSPAMNMVAGRLAHANERLTVVFGEHSLVVPEEVVAECPGLRAYDGADVVLGIRPEDFEDALFAGDAPPERSITTVCTLREELGSEVLVHLANGLVARVDPQTNASVDAPLHLVVNTRRLHFFDPESGLAIRG